jgi:hypothetical protein
LHRLKEVLDVLATTTPETTAGFCIFIGAELPHFLDRRAG